MSAPGFAVRTGAVSDRASAGLVWSWRWFAPALNSRRAPKHHLFAEAHLEPRSLCGYAAREFTGEARADAQCVQCAAIAGKYALAITSSPA